MSSLVQRCVAEALGTALLLAAVVGSGIMGESLSSGNAAVALLANSLATGCILYVVIVMLAPASGAHFNPLVTLVARFERSITSPAAAAYVLSQLGGAIVGAGAANFMFGLPVFLPSVKVRTGVAQWVSEGVATFGLILVVRLIGRRGTQTVAAAVAAYITAAYWFTASTSFANPTVTVARSLTDSFSGIQPAHVPAFIAAQVSGAALGYITANLFLRRMHAS